MSGEEIRKNISKNIVKYREKANLSQKELATRLGVTPSRVSNWEQGANSPTIEILFEVCKILGVSINDIYGIYPEASIELTFVEIDHIKKYRDLDDHGKDIIDTILEKEYARCEDEYVEIVARGGKYKVKREALIELAKRLDAEPYEEDHDLC